jgi:integrase
LAAVFCGLRASELRGLRWADVDFEGRQINVTQRADASHKIGKLKSKAAYRSLRLSPIVLNALREWKLTCPKGDLGLVFPNGLGKVESYANLDRARVCTDSAHCGHYRARASFRRCRQTHRQQRWRACPQRSSQNTGCTPYATPAPPFGLSRATIRSRYRPSWGHSSIKVTFDTYGHLFADSEADQRAAEDIQVRLLGM